MKAVLRALISLAVLFVLAAAVAGGGLMWVFYTYGQGLPDYSNLADYEPPVMTRVHAGDGRLLAEYATERRVFVPIEAIPRRVIHAFLSAEDKNFYEHPGVDPLGIAKAAIINLRNMGTGRRPVGASTITQQVAKNFLLTNEVSFDRKIKEAILSFRIERALSKDRILELYMNEIYLGRGSYGVAAAALNYFNKSLGDLSLAETAYLAALPKAPNNYDPVRHYAAAVGRRDWVLGRMVENGFVAPDEAEAAQGQPLATLDRPETEFVTAPYFAEEIRRELFQQYGERTLYQGGLLVRTTLDPKLQEIATRALRQGLEAYDRRHGYRGPVARLGSETAPLAGLATVDRPKGAEDLGMAVVTGVDADAAFIAFADGGSGRIPLAEMRWARPIDAKGELGPRPARPADVLAVGDVILTRPASGPEDNPYPEGSHTLAQIPEVEGGIVAMDPHTGRVLAMVGGYSFDRSQFNRAVQARRQPGSSFKPFVYMPALDAGYTPSTLILDAPFVIDQGPGLPKWRPANYSREFYGPSTMRLGIEKSRNLMTVRLAQTIGMDRVAAYARKFGVIDDLPEQLSMALGAAETTLMRMTTAYAMMVNGGKGIVPTLIDRVQDRQGRTIFRHDTRDCPDCRAAYWTAQPVPQVADVREQIADPATVYQMVSMLQGAVERGTGQRIAEVGKPLAGKTGTSNESRDTWFVGFSPDLAVGVFVGMDEPASLGRNETGSNVAAPIFRDFMAKALSDRPSIPFRIPPGIRMVRVDAKTGQLAAPGDRSAILEAFRPGTVPAPGQTAVIEGISEDGGGGTGLSIPEAGGLY